MGGGEVGFFGGFFGLAFALVFACGNTKPISSTSVGRPETDAGNMLAALRNSGAIFWRTKNLRAGTPVG